MNILQTSLLSLLLLGCAPDLILPPNFDRDVDASRSTAETSVPPPDQHTGERSIREVPADSSESVDSASTPDAHDVAEDVDSGYTSDAGASDSAPTVDGVGHEDVPAVTTDNSSGEDTHLSTADVVLEAGTDVMEVGVRDVSVDMGVLPRGRCLVSTDCPRHCCYRPVATLLGLCGCRILDVCLPPSTTCSP